MTSSIPVRFVAAFSLVALLGAGCAPSETTPTPVSVAPPIVTGLQPMRFNGLSSKDAATKINMATGSVILMRQGFTGLASPILSKLGLGENNGVRKIVIQRFAPAHTVDLAWELNAETKSATGKLQTKETSGSVTNADLKGSHTLFLPAAWPAGSTDAFASSVIWVSQDVYQDLVRIKNSSLDFGLFDPSLSTSLKTIDDFKAALAKLKGQVDKIIDRQDVYVIKAEDPSDWKLKINGQDVTVQVIKAHSWFGDIVVLNNPQYPLVLKVTIDPLAVGVLDLVTGKGAFKDYLGYEVTELQEIQG